MKNYQVVNRNTGLVEFEGNLTDCRNNLRTQPELCGIKESDEPLFDEDGECNIFECNK